MKLVLALVTIGAVAAGAADLQRGESFTAGQPLLASQLQELVDDAIILPGFYQDKTIKYLLTGTDVILVYSPSLAAYRTLPANAFLYTNSAFITSQTEKTTPVAADTLLLFDASVGALKKVTAGNLALNNTNLINGQPVVAGYDPDAYVLLLNYGTNARTTISNLFLGFKYAATITNLSAHYAPTNLDRLLIWDSIAGTNKTITLSNLVDNLPANASPDPARDVVLTTTASNMAKVTIGTITTMVSNSIASRFVSDEYSIVAGNLINTNHGLSTTPAIVRAVLVCKTANNGYSVGDEVDVQASWYESGGFAFNEWVFGANSTNAFVSLNIVPNSIFDKTNSAAAFGVFTASEWRAKIYSRP